jgi:hypothetical protein
MTVLVALAFAAAVFALAPLYVVIPTAAHSPAWLDLSLNIKRLSYALNPTLAAAAAAWFAMRWRAWTRSRRIGGVFALLVVLGAAVFSRINVVEKIFPPADGAIASPIAGFHDVEDSDMVIGVTLGGETRAYPVRFLAHHHLWNDKLNGIPILPNY